MFKFKPLRSRYLSGALYVLLGVTSTVSVIADDSHKTRVRPMEMGVSGGSIEHIISKNRLFCYAGTLGALVTDGTGQYILSNNHVLAKENNPDEPGLEANGYNIIQPGLLDEGGPCSTSSGDFLNKVATLSEYVFIEFGKGKNPPPNYVDAAIAEVDASCTVVVDGVPVSVPCVRADGTIKHIGPVAREGGAAISMTVQKSGRTTGHTFGTITSINVDIDVKYNSGTARFLDQMRIVGLCDTAFSDAGDSGSAIVNLPNSDDSVESMTENDRLVVGLLFAGGGSSTFANHIGDVLADLGSLLPEVPEGTPLTLSMVQCGSADCELVTDTVPDEYCADSGGSEGPGNGRGRPFNTPSPLGLEIASDIKARHSDELFANSSVVGHGVGVDINGDPVIEVYVKNGSRRAAGKPIPASIEGIPVRIVVTGEILAY